MPKIKTKPEMGPGGLPESAATGSGSVSMPSETPPRSGGLASLGGLAPTMAGMGDAAPSLPAAESLGADITAWLNNKKINALWTINQNRNSWVSIEGIGWKKLANNSDSAIVALTMLGAHAREKGSIVNYREEADGMIHEMYVW